MIALDSFFRVLAFEGSMSSQIKEDGASITLPLIF
jgi:hypothetical protein